MQKAGLISFISTIVLSYAGNNNGKTFIIPTLEQRRSFRQKHERFFFKIYKTIIFMFKTKYI